MDKWVFEGYSITDNTTLYAKWIINNYTVTYTDAFELPEATESFTVLDSFEVPNPTRVGYDFVGWIRGEEDTPEKDVTVEAGEAENIVFTAVWTPVKYGITYDTAGGSLEDVSISEYDIEKSFTVTDIPTRVGYDFVGWEYKIGEAVGTEFSPEIPVGTIGDITFTAVWEHIKYTIKYEMNGGSFSEFATTKYYIDSEDITIPTPERLGYTFLGWTLEDSDEPKAEFIIPKGSLGDKTCEANWEIIHYNVTYDFAGGEPSGVCPETYTVLDSFTVGVPSKYGYDFLRFACNGEPLERGAAVIKEGTVGDLAFSVDWSPQRFFIEYDPVYGKLPEDAVKKYDFETEDFTLPIPTRLGYEFTGWTGEGITEPTVSVTVPKGTLGNMSFVANWEIIHYNITYELNSGEVAEENPNSYTVIDSFTLINPTKRGYTFLAWEYNLGGADITENNVTIPIGIARDIHFEAIFELTEYSISYELGGGEIGEGRVDSYNMKSEDITLPTPTRLGYEFAGWIGEGITDPVRELVISKNSVGDRTYTASWTIIAYSITQHLDGGTLEEPLPTSFTVLDLPITLPNAIKEDNYFIGWYTDSGYTNSITRITECENIELYLGFTVGTLEGMEFSVLDGGNYAVSSYTGNVKTVLVPYLYNGKPVTEISANAFEGNSVQKITLSERITKIGDRAFLNCTSLTDVNFSTGLESIGEYAFQRCTALSSVELPEGLNSLPYGAFYRCTKLSSVSLPSTLERIGSYAFYDIRTLRYITLPEGLLYIDNGAFQYTGLSNIHIPKSTLYIGDSVFYGTYVNSVTFENGSKIAGIGHIDNTVISRLLPGSTKYESGYYIGSEENPYLVHIDVDGTVSSAAIHTDTAIIMGFADQKKIKSVTVPTGVRGIGSRAFYGCTALETLVIEGGVLTICTDAFSGCTALADVSIGEGLIYMGDRAFYECTELYSIEIPESHCVFGGNWKPNTLGNIIRENKIYKYSSSSAGTGYIWDMHSVEVSGNLKSSALTFSDVESFSYGYYDGYAVFAGCGKFAGGEFTVPETLYGIPITAVINLAGDDNDKITALNVPSSVSNLGTALSGCSFETFYLPESIKGALPPHMFSGFEVDEIVLHNGITDIGSAFSNSKIKRITIPESVRSIDEMAFSGCNNLEYVILPSTLRNIGGCAFLNGYIIDVFYNGNATDYERVSKVSDSLSGAKLYYYSETAPTESGNFWHYVGDVPTKW